jgi:two-component sensor histidine kinase
MRPAAWSIRRRLLLLVAALAVPMNLLVVAALVQLADREREAQQRNLQYTARAIVSATDAALMAHIAIGRALAQSPALLADDLAAFRVEAERALPDRHSEWLVVSDLSGQQLMNLLRPDDSKLPVRAGLVSHRKAIETGAMVISDVFRGPVAQNWLVSIDFPILRDGRPFRVMSMVIDTAAFRDLLARQNQPATWLTGIADRRGNFVARLPHHDANVGQPASAGWRAVMDRSGIERFAALDGEMVLNANEISALSGWRVGIGVKEAELARPVWTTIGLAVAASAAVSLLSLLLALRLAHGIAEPVAELERKAASLVAGQPEILEPKLPEVARVWQALEVAMARRAAAERQGRLLTDELAHRVKNTLAVVQALALQTLRADPDPRAFAETFSSRLASLARAHDLLTGHGWTGAAIDQIATVVVEPFHRPDGTATFAISGPPVQMTPNGAITLSLMLHELATNAAKHGALRQPHGHVAVEWTIARESSRALVHLLWRESGGPAVAPPARQGFGTRLLETGAAQLGGRIERKWAAEGLVCHLVFPQE